MCGPHHCAGRGASASHSAILRPLLQRSQNASIFEQGCTSLSLGTARRCHSFKRNPWRTSSPLWSNLRFSVHTRSNSKARAPCRVLSGLRLLYLLRSNWKSTHHDFFSSRTAIHHWHSSIVRTLRFCRYAATSLRAKRMQPPTLKNGIWRRCRSRRTLGTEIFRKSATSGIVSSSSAGPGSTDIHVKEQDKNGNYMQ